MQFKIDGSTIGLNLSTAPFYLLAVDPTAPDTVVLFLQQEAPANPAEPQYAAPLQNWILKSDDGGATWQRTPAGGVLFEPTIYLNSTAFSGEQENWLPGFVIDPDIPTTWYVMQGLSVCRSSDSGRTWYPLATGLPLVDGPIAGYGMQALKIHRASRTLWVPTQGRGVWELAIPITAPRIRSISPPSNAAETPLALAVSGFNFDANGVVQINGQDTPTTFVSSTELDASVPASAFPEPGFYYVSVYEPGAGGGASDPLPLAVDVPILSIAMRRVGSSAEGPTASYTITVSNIVAPTVGTVTVAEAAPPGLTPVSMAGLGWSCSSIACTRGDSLAAGASYPPITVVVDVAGRGPLTKLITASVSGGGALIASTAASTAIYGPPPASARCREMIPRTLRPASRLSVEICSLLKPSEPGMLPELATAWSIWPLKRSFR